MGLHVVVSDGNKNAPGFAFADDKIIASTYDIELTVKKSKDYNDHRKIDGVICMASDVPLTAATVANELSIPGITIESAMLSSDKIAMKDKTTPSALLLTRQGVPILGGTQNQNEANVSKGAYAVIDCEGNPEIILLATGSEVSLAIEVANKLEGKKKKIEYKS